MGNQLRNTHAQNTADVRHAQATVDNLTSQLGSLGKEAALLGASNVPVLGSVVDVGQGLWNAFNGNWGAAALDFAGAIPGPGDAAKTAVRGTRIAKSVARIGKKLDAAKAALSKAKEMARRRVAAKKYLSNIKKKRDAIKRKYKNCNSKSCADKRDAELRKTTKLPAVEKGDFVDPKTGKRVPAGEGVFKPKPGTPLAKGLEKHGVDSIPYKNGHPDLSGFPPKGYASPTGKSRSYEIAQSGNTNKRAAHRADVRSAKAENKAIYGDTPKGGQWHHTENGSTIQYVDKDVHGPLYHQGSASMNQTEEF